jgi:preprotein translocase subunit YajC
VNGGSGFFLLIIAFGFLYFVLVRPQRRRQVDTQRMLSQLQVGDEVVTAGGIYGTVTELVDDDDLLLEIAPELRVRVARKAIGAVIHREEPEEAEEEAQTEHPEPPVAENGG